MTPLATGRRQALARLDALAAKRGVRLEHMALLAPFTSLRVGGPADRLAQPRSRGELLAVLELAREARIPWLVLGNGSNVVIADAGVRGLVIRNRARSVTVRETALHGDAGAPMALVVRRAADAGLSGVEWGTAVPGTLGGAVWANAGAHDGDIAGILKAAEVWDPDSGRTSVLMAADCRLAYRESRFKHGREVVVSADLGLTVGERSEIRSRIARFQAQRRATQPVADRNAGSVFRNPVGDAAGRLIEAAGLKRLRMGSAMVSPTHANFIVADHGGRAADVRVLADHVRTVIAERFGVVLVPEIDFIGDWESWS